MAEDTNAHMADTAMNTPVAPEGKSPVTSAAEASQPGVGTGAFSDLSQTLGNDAQAIVDTDIKSGKELAKATVDSAADMLSATLAAAEGDTEAVVPVLELDAWHWLQAHLAALNLSQVSGTLAMIFALGSGANIVAGLNTTIDLNTQKWLHLALASVKGIQSQLGG